MEIQMLLPKIILSFDSDEAGQNAMFKLVEDLKNSNLSVRVTMPNKDAKDLDELYNSEGENAVKECVNKTYTINEFRLSLKFTGPLLFL